MNPAKEIIVDDFRFISRLHTTARQLYICTNIIKTIGNKHLTKSMLTQLLIKWSLEEEGGNDEYKNRKGKITENGKPTTALNHYIDLCNSLGLVSNLHHFYANSRIAYLVTYFSEYKNETAEYLTKGERAIYFFLLLNVDADGLLLILQMIVGASDGYNQKKLQELFKDALNLRLTSKQDFATIKAKDQLGEKYRAINYTWKNAEKYAEHLVVPRCEWLSDIGLIEIRRAGNENQYIISEAGKTFYNRLIEMPQTEIKDINENWLNDNAFASIAEAIVGNKDLQTFKNLEGPERISFLGKTLKNATKVVKTSGAFRYSLFDTLLFISLEHLLLHNMITEFSDSINEIRKGLRYEEHYFTVKESGRINENYISLRPA